jgi:polyhydroxybutyrate depolymerase
LIVMRMIQRTGSKSFARARVALVVIDALASLASCHRREPSPASSDPNAKPNAPIASVDPALDSARASLLVDRPYTLRVPASYDRHAPAPLVILLHGYGSHAIGIESYLGFRALVETKGIFLAVPNGTVDARGDRFWNAGDACCNLFDAKVDDVAYITALMDDVARKYAIDPKRVYVVGHSNGGFMAERLACDRASRIAAIVDIAGAASSETLHCSPSESVASLHVHGDADTIIRTSGGKLFEQPALPTYPSLAVTMGSWASRNACSGAPSATGKRLDLDRGLAGAETRIDRYASCAKSDVELWTVEGGAHSPDFTPAFAENVYAFLAAHAKR